MTIDRRIFLNGTFPGIKDDTQEFEMPKTTSLIHFNWLIGLQKEERMKIRKMVNDYDSLKEELKTTKNEISEIKEMLMQLMEKK